MGKYFLDTNIVLGYLRAAPYAAYMEKRFALLTGRHTLAISVVTAGELQSLAIRHRWGEKKLNQLKSMLSMIPLVPITVGSQPDRYAEIDTFSQGKNPIHPLPGGMSARNMGKNDLWIAATASLLKYELITTDGDFRHLHGIYLDVIVVDPTLTEADA